VEVNVYVDFVDLANPTVEFVPSGDRYRVWFDDNTSTLLTAGEAQVLAKVFEHVAETIVDRESADYGTMPRGHVMGVTSDLPVKL
jgi:hypothetical protein